MRKFYEKKEVLFAVTWILAYCLVMAPIKGNYGYSSIWMLLALLAFAAGITAFVKANHLEKKYGLTGWPKDMKRYQFLLPMWILATGNLWGGIAPSFQGMQLVTAVLSMALVGYVEEMIFRGFLFRGMLSEEKPAAAVIVSSLTFGMGHIINLFTGQGGLETMLQLIFAVCWGFIFTMVFYKSGSLIPCIIAHAMIDVFSLIGADDPVTDRICIGVTIVTAVIWCIFLSRLKRAEAE